MIQSTFIPSYSRKWKRVKRRRIFVRPSYLSPIQSKFLLWLLIGGIVVSLSMWFETLRPKLEKLLSITHSKKLLLQDMRTPLPPAADRQTRNPIISNHDLILTDNSPLQIEVQDQNFYTTELPSLEQKLSPLPKAGQPRLSLSESENTKIISLDTDLSFPKPQDISIDSKTVETLRPVAEQRQDLYFARQPQTEEDVLNQRMNRSTSYIIPRLYEEALGTNALFRSFFIQHQETMTCHSLPLDIFPKNAVYSKLCFTQNSPILAGKFEPSLERHAIFSTDFAESKPLDASLSTFSEDLTLFSPEGFATPPLTQRSIFEHQLLTEILVLLAIGLVIWSGLLLYLPLTTVKSFKQSLTARYRTPESFFRLPPWQFSDWRHQRSQGIPFLKMTFHEVSIKKEGHSRKKRTVVRIHPRGILKGEE